MSQLFVKPRNDVAYESTVENKDEKTLTNPSEVTNVPQIFTCEDCGKEYKQFGRFKRHVQEKHTKVVMDALIKCDECPSYFENIKKLNRHKKIHM